MVIRSALFGVERTDLRNTAHSGVAEFYIDCGRQREVEVDTRPEFNESEMVIDIGVVAWTGICHDTAGNCSGYLAHQDIMSLGSTDDNGGTFVFSARLGKIGREETAV